MVFIDRWNAYLPTKWEPHIEVQLVHGQNAFRLPVRMGTHDFGIFHEIFIRGYYDADLGHPATILDLGGYRGFSALAFAARFPQASIAVVEPHPANFQRLNANLHLNGVRATLFEAAATAADGPVTLYLGAEITHALTPNAHSIGESIKVEGLSVPTMLSRLGWDRVDLLKIDVEGAEEQVFAAQQPWLSQVNVIIGEYHGAYGIPELRCHLKPLGFEVTALPYPGVFIARRSSNEELCKNWD